MAHRLTSLAMALALSATPAVLSACTALCFAGPTTAIAASDPEASHRDHDGHGPVAAPAAASAHAHHDTSASARPHEGVANTAPRPDSDARLVGDCDDCCAAGAVAFAAAPAVDRADAKAFAAVPAVPVASFQPRAATDPAPAPTAPVPPPSPTRAPLALRI